MVDMVAQLSDPVCGVGATGQTIRKAVQASIAFFWQPTCRAAGKTGLQVSTEPHPASGRR